MTPTITSAQRRRRLLERHGFLAPFGDASEAADRLVGLHSSDPATVYLSLWARTPGITIADIETALYGPECLRRVWAMRRTLFVVTDELASIMYPAAGEAVAAEQLKKLVGMVEKQGLGDGSSGSAADWVERLSDETVAALDTLGHATTAIIRDAVPGLATQIAMYQGSVAVGSQSVASRLLMVLAMQGRVLRGRPSGTWRSSQYEWVSQDAWLGTPLAFTDRAASDVALVSRWLNTYGPGTVTDVKWWTGWTKTRTVQTLEAIGAVTVDLEGTIGFALPDDVEELSEEPTEHVMLLPGLDSTIMGWKEREWFLGNLADQLFDRNGNAGPTVWVDGHVVGGWAQRADGSIAVGLLQDVGRLATSAIEAEAEELGGWMGPVGLKSRFPSPHEKALRG